MDGMPAGIGAEVSTIQTAIPTLEVMQSASHIPKSWLAATSRKWTSISTVLSVSLPCLQQLVLPH